MKPTTHKSTPPAKATREAYVSMDREERDILRTLGLRERALYPELKWLASFKTGEVKHFGKRVITFQFLADLITVPTTQGRAVALTRPAAHTRSMRCARSAVGPPWRSPQAMSQPARRISMFG